MMAAMLFFTKVPKWHWHYDPFMDSLYLTTTSRVHLYIFFQWVFATLILSPLFDSAAPFLEVPLYMAHPYPVPPHQAQPPTASPPPVHPVSSESDPLEWMDSSSFHHQHQVMVTHQPPPGLQASYRTDSSPRSPASGGIRP